MKKFSQIVLYTVLAVVVLGLILTSVLKKNFAPEIAVPTFASKGLEVSAGDGSAQYDVFKDEKSYKKFEDIYSNSYKLTILYSIFSGKISRKQEVVPYGVTEPKFQNGFVITFDYHTNPQTLKVNGKEYLPSQNADAVTYTIVKLNVMEDKGLRSVFIYFYSEENDSWYKLTTLANFDSLYDYIQKELPMFNGEE